MFSGHGGITFAGLKGTCFLPIFLLKAHPVGFGDKLDVLHGPRIAAGDDRCAQDSLRGVESRSGDPCFSIKTAQGFSGVEFLSP
jgi:hypothetical protein